jgi:hypothetical protein
VRHNPHLEQTSTIKQVIIRKLTTFLRKNRV